MPSLIFSVSYTTRPPRPGEEHGKDYFFVDPDEFREMAARDRFYEWAEVYGNYYGTSRQFVEERTSRGEDVLLDIDVQGARSVKELNPEAVLIFIMPPSFGELATRLRRRGQDDDAQIQRRLNTALEEIGHYRFYDFVVINDDLEHSVDLVQALVLAGRCRVRNNYERIRKIVMTFGEETHDRITEQH